MRQNVCERHLRFQNDTSLKLTDALEGLQLRTSIVEGKFFHTREGPTGRIVDPVYPGIIGLLLDELATRAGFTWRDSWALLREPQSGANETFTELLAWSAEFFDVSAFWWDNTVERLQLGLSFPDGYVDGSFILVGVESANVEESINLWAWLKPFDPSVWVLILITIFFSGCMYQLLEVIGNPNRYKGWRTKDSLGNNLFLSTLLFTQHFQFQPRTPASRLLAASMALWALLISSAYTANLASYFVAQNLPSGHISSIDDAIKSKTPLCIWGKAAIFEFVQKTYPDALLIPKDEDVQVYYALNTGECRYAVVYKNGFDEYARDKKTNPNCNLKQFGRTVQHVTSGFATVADSGRLCTNLIGDVLNIYFREMKADGFVDKVWAEHLARNRDIDCTAKEGKDNEASQRVAAEMAGTFIIHCAVAVVAILLAILTKYCPCLQESGHEKRISKASGLSSDDDYHQQVLAQQSGKSNDPDVNGFVGNDPGFDDGPDIHLPANYDRTPFQSRRSVMTNDPDPYGPAFNDPSTWDFQSPDLDLDVSSHTAELSGTLKRQESQADTILGMVQSSGMRHKSSNTLLAEWEEHTDPDGRTFYVNKTLGKVQWNHPLSTSTPGTNRSNSVRFKTKLKY